jgi:hypothetical protein
VLGFGLQTAQLGVDALAGVEDRETRFGPRLGLLETPLNRLQRPGGAPALLVEVALEGEDLGGGTPLSLPARRVRSLAEPLITLATHRGGHSIRGAREFSGPRGREVAVSALGRPSFAASPSGLG